MKGMPMVITLVAGLVVVLAGGCGGHQVTAFEDCNDVVVTLERTPCFGFCPVYTLTVHGTGTVKYEGRDFVDVKGTVTTNISRNTVAELVAAFEKADYFSLKDAYTERTITDAPSVLTSITVSGVTKSVEHYPGDLNAPEALTVLENTIDELVNSEQWIE